jgi:hypothetical protein
MKVEWKDLERVLREQEPQQMAALEEHARACEACRAELEAWQEISAAARTMKREWSSPHLWPQIRERLEAEARAEAERQQRWSFGWLWQGFSAHWQLAAATVALLAVTLTGTWMIVRHATGPKPGPRDNALLNDPAFIEVEKAEAAYAQAIENLSKQAEQKLQKADTPILANYREKLLVLDSAIAECRRQIERNKFNAHLRSELMSSYMEKKKTLEEVLGED